MFDEKKYSKQYYKQNKKRLTEQARWAHIRRFYGLTKEEYYKLLSKQGDACALCGRTGLTSKQLHVDHCHETNRIRGILCNVCNWALGALGDTEDSIKKVLEYLKDNGK